MNASLALQAVIDIVVAGVVFWILQRLFGPARRRDANPDMRNMTDLCHWFLNAVVFAPLCAWTVAVLLAPLATAGVAEHPIGVAMAGMPWAAQLAVALVVFDLAAYWRHRLMHSDKLWPVHAVHHSSTRLTWLSGVRNHPLNIFAIHLTGGAVVVAFGFSPDIVAAVGLIRFYWVCFLHTNIRLTLGPLDYVIATPRFHRWHHVPDGVRHRNYAGFFAGIDLLFGTFHLPRDRQAETFGLDDPGYPTDYVGQIAAPFRHMAAIVSSSHRNRKRAVLD